MKKWTKTENSLLTIKNSRVKDSVHRTRASHMQISHWASRSAFILAGSFSNLKSATTRVREQERVRREEKRHEIEHSRAHGRDAFTREKRTPVILDTLPPPSCTYTHIHTCRKELSKISNPTNLVGELPRRWCTPSVRISLRPAGNLFLLYVRRIYIRDSEPPQVAVRKRNAKRETRRREAGVWLRLSLRVEKLFLRNDLTTEHRRVPQRFQSRVARIFLNLVSGIEDLPIFNTSRGNSRGTNGIIQSISWKIDKLTGVLIKFHQVCYDNTYNQYICSCHI